MILAGLFASDTVHVERLIEQLGSEFFAERVAATKALDRLGVPVLEPLREASENSDDAEVRRRAERLVKLLEPRAIRERALTIRMSQLRPEEKAQKFRPYLSEGMTADEVRFLLGQPVTVLHLSGSCTCYYEQCGLTIDYDGDLKATAIR